MSIEFDADEALLIVNKIKPLLAGKGSAMQGAILAELLSIWVCGHYPVSMREELLSFHIELVREFIANEAGGETFTD